MGIRKGWALCGAREKRCFISHAVSSHPLLELQTLGLFTLASPHHQDLPLDSIQKKQKKQNSNLPSFPPPLPLWFFFLPLLHLPPPHSIADKKTGTLWWLIPFIICLSRPEDEERHSWPDSGGTHGQGAHLFFFFLFFLLPQLSLLTVSLWISFLILHMQMIWDGGEGVRLDSLPPLPLLLLTRLLFPWWNRSGLASRSTLRNHGHGVSLGKQRPGQKGFTQALIILTAISGGSPEPNTLLELLSLIVQSPLWLK